MRLHYLRKEGKRFMQIYWITIIIAVLAFLGYGLGYISGAELQRVPLSVDLYKKEENVSENIQKKTIVASKSGTKFYYIWCGGSNRIKEENKVYFESKEDALKKGYEPAKKCPGL